jgi:hypothetical protein
VIDIAIEFIKKNLELIVFTFSIVFFIAISNRVLGLVYRIFLVRFYILFDSLLIFILKICEGFEIVWRSSILSEND